MISGQMYFVSAFWHVCGIMELMVVAARWRSREKLARYEQVHAWFTCDVLRFWRVHVRRLNCFLFTSGAIRCREDTSIKRFGRQRTNKHQFGIRPYTSTEKRMNIGQSLRCQVGNSILAQIENSVVLRRNQFDFMETVDNESTSWTSWAEKMFSIWRT